MANKKMSVAKTLRAHGQLGVIKTYTSTTGSYNPATGKVQARGPSSLDSTRAIMLMDQLTKIPSRTYGNAGVTTDANTLVEGVQKWALVDAMGREPRIQDHVVVGGEEWHILNVQTIADQGQPVMYILALRR